MNGLSLVIFGVILFTLAYFLLKIQGKIGEITKAVNLGFKTIEDGISKNVIDPNSPFGGISKAVDQTFVKIEQGINDNILGPNGVLVTADNTLILARDASYHMATEIRNGRNLLTGKICPVIGDCQTILDDVGNPLIDAGSWIYGIGDAIDVEILDAHPFTGLSKPFHDVGGTVDKVGDLCLDAETKLGIVTVEIMNAANFLDNLTTKVNNLGIQTEFFRSYMDTTVKTNALSLEKDINQIHTNIDGLLSTFKTGTENSLTELENARSYLDTLLAQLVNKKMIAGLVVAGIGLIILGVSIGL